MSEPIWFAFRYPNTDPKSQIVPHSEFRKLTISDAVQLANQKGAISEKVSSTLAEALDIMTDHGTFIVVCLAP